MIVKGSAKFIHYIKYLSCDQTKLLSAKYQGSFVGVNDAKVAKNSQELVTAGINHCAATITTIKGSDFFMLGHFEAVSCEAEARNALNKGLEKLFVNVKDDKNLEFLTSFYSRIDLGGKGDSAFVQFARENRSKVKEIFADAFKEKGLACSFKDEDLFGDRIKFDGNKVSTAIKKVGFEEYLQRFSGSEINR